MLVSIPTSDTHITTTPYGQPVLIAGEVGEGLVRAFLAELATVVVSSQSEK